MNNEYEEEIIKFKKENKKNKLINNTLKFLIAISFIAWAIFRINELKIEEKEKSEQTKNSVALNDKKQVYTIENFKNEYNKWDTIYGKLELNGENITDIANYWKGIYIAKSADCSNDYIGVCFLKDDDGNIECHILGKYNNENDFFEPYHWVTINVEEITYKNVDDILIYEDGYVKFSGDLYYKYEE